MTMVRKPERGGQAVVVGDEKAGRQAGLAQGELVRSSTLREEPCGNR